MIHVWLSFLDDIFVLFSLTYTASYVSLSKTHPSIHLLLTAAVVVVITVVVLEVADRPADTEDIQHHPLPVVLVCAVMLLKLLLQRDSNEVANL